MIMQNQNLSFIKTIGTTFFFILLSFMIQGKTMAQDQANAQASMEEEKYSLIIGVGYFRPIMSYEGVAYPNATFDPEIGFGFSFFTSLDYALSEKFAVGVGFNGSIASANFIKDATVNNETIDGYLDGGGVSNTCILVNLTYAPPGSGIQPYVKLGLGYFMQEVELGDVPEELTNNEETEVFPDYKSSGFGILPEIGVRYQNFFISAAYSISFNDLTGETVDGGFTSPGTITSQGLQINLAYHVWQF
jgi:hypothetical protein